MFGITMGCYDKFEDLYKFMVRTQYTINQARLRAIEELNKTDEVKDLKKTVADQRENVRGATAKAITQGDTKDGDSKNGYVG